MKYILESGFNKIYKALGEDYLAEGAFAYRNKDIGRYIIPANIKQDTGDIKVRKDSELPKVNWMPLSYIENKDASGIYVIKNNLTNQLYFGKASTFNDRRAAHERGDLKDSKFLHAAIRHAQAHPEEDSSFSWGIYKLVDPSDLNDEEIDAINDPRWDTYNSPYDYNLTPGGDGSNPFTYEDYPEVYDNVAQMLYSGMSGPEIINYMNSSPESPIVKNNLPKLNDNPKGNLTLTMNKYPARYKRFIHNYDEITTKLDNGKVVIRTPEVSKSTVAANLPDPSQVVDLYADMTFIGRFNSVDEAAKHIYKTERDAILKYNRENNRSTKVSSIASNLSDKAHNYSWGKKITGKRYWVEKAKEE